MPGATRTDCPLTVACAALLKLNMPRNADAGKGRVTPGAGCNCSAAGSAAPHQAKATPASHARAGSPMGPADRVVGERFIVDIQELKARLEGAAQKKAPPAPCAAGFVACDGILESN